MTTQTEGVKAGHTAKPLTPLQSETLGLIRDGKVSQVNCGTAAWRTFGASPTVVGKLMSLGLARWPTAGTGGVAVLTDAGEALAKAQGPSNG
ncbi:hypothetical protein [Brevundimonas sp. NIBR11]|uniref:hypothetical protein n=1 Tax=Brevundimonas sp. NIBR11 TaxID=3015999 RepID=UPI0022F0A886|nr:hypothetical protein [Brevundimonas sp. NIBR11]WGM31459.1 hypothetical protein KKHFBJBL_01706 [Brevundimonas sp. NIBR11]